ncbi:BlaR1 peptidase M56 [Aquisphaera giovannonii]|uniref:BlaR1 peptidase M56 n=1 Tax=Aquisphaera giovannonii TaxID=406548 RepID=A0A5B9W968_9BACT|nr:M56 family metallopeptidase [Aquisphaera giovannonii]QEH36967.1 BlaR1 peptidase M56 [Aquisphaera giovannonii]
MSGLLSLGLSNAAAASAMALGVALLALFLGRRPAWRHCLVLVVLLKLVTPPIWEVAVPGLDGGPAGDGAPIPRAIPAEPEELTLVEGVEFFVEDEGPATVAPPGTDAAAAMVGPSPSPAAPWAALLGKLWLAGALAMIGLSGIRIFRFARVLRGAYPVPDEVQDEIAALAERMGVHRTPAAYFLDAAVSPMVWSLGRRPRLILPAGLWKTLDGRQRSMVLAHELAHLRRGDHLVRLFELAVCSLYWWLPVTWWARRALREAEEQCCDAWVIWAFPDEARTYAETLLDTIDFLIPIRAPEPLLASGFGRTQQLRRRLTMIMLGRTPRTLGAASTFAALSLAAVLLPLRPSLAQKPDEAKTAETAITVTADADSATQGEARSEALTIDVVGKPTDEDDPNVVTFNVAGKPTVADEPRVLTFNLAGTERADVAALARVEIRDDEAKDGPKDDKSAAAVSQSIHIVIKNGDKVDEIQAESIADAIQKLKQKIGTIAAEAPKGAETEARIQALQKALNGLPRLDIKKPGAGDAKIITGDRLVLSRVGSPEEAAKNKARVDELRKGVSKLQKELVEKQKELARAQAELARVSARVVVTRAPEIRITGDRPGQRMEARNIVIRDQRTAPDAKPGELKADDRKRLDSLERSLAKLLDEVKELKKHDGDKPK